MKSKKTIINDEEEKKKLNIKKLNKKIYERYYYIRRKQKDMYEKKYIKSVEENIINPKNEEKKLKPIISISEEKYLIEL
jgi:hypothetical protein